MGQKPLELEKFEVYIAVYVFAVNGLDGDDVKEVKQESAKNAENSRKNSEERLFSYVYFENMYSRMHSRL